MRDHRRLERPCSAEVSGIDEGGTRGVELGDEGGLIVGDFVNKLGLKGSGGGGKVERIGGACDVRVAGGVNSDPFHVAAAAAEEGGVAEDGIDDEGQRPIVTAKLEGDGVVGEDMELAGNGLSRRSWC